MAGGGNREPEAAITQIWSITLIGTVTGCASWTGLRSGGELGTGLVGGGAALSGGAPAVALGVDLEDGRVMDEAVDGGDGDGRIGEDLVPLAEGLIASDNEAL